jgi:outer membrane protein OmpA-like peptidoglycan-associated protein
MKKLMLTIAGSMILASCASNNFVPASEVDTGTYVRTSKTMMTNSVFFAENSSDISTDYVHLLKVNASYLRSNRSATILLAGNSSEPGGSTYNKELALERAENVKVVLMRLGVQANQITVTSNGKDNLKYHRPDKEVLLKDQRVDILYQTYPPYTYKVDKVPEIDVYSMF